MCVCCVSVCGHYINNTSISLAVAYFVSSKADGSSSFSIYSFFSKRLDYFSVGWVILASACVCMLHAFSVKRCILYIAIDRKCYSNKSEGVRGEWRQRKT